MEFKQLASLESRTEKNVFKFYIEGQARHGEVMAALQEMLEYVMSDYQKQLAAQKQNGDESAAKGE